jgi:hypothetical protein
MLVRLEDDGVGRHRQEVVAMAAGLKRDEQSVQREGGHGGERELRCREDRTRRAGGERREDQAER